MIKIHEFESKKFSLIFLALQVMFAALLITGCTSSQSNPNVENSSAISKVVQISSGTSFGECIGYCKKEVHITASEITFKKYSWDGSVPEVTGSYINNEEDWAELVDSLNFDKFMKLDYLNDIIGCPDCADGGSEWIEISDGTSNKRITFEHGEDIPDFEKFTKAVRAVRNTALSKTSEE
jgi:hypothetical protein